MDERAEVQELSALLRSKVPLIWIETHEELRILKLLSQACNLEQHLMMRWSIVDGLGRVFGTGGGVVARHGQGGMDLDGDGQAIAQTNDVLDCLKHIDRSTQNGVYVLCDAHPGFDNPVVVRLIREIAMDHAKSARTLVFIGPKFEKVPSELLRMAAHFKPHLPTRADIRAIVIDEAKQYQQHNGESVRGERATIEKLILHLQGLEYEDVRRLVRQALKPDGLINQDDIRRVLATKHKALGGADVLGFEPPQANFNAVGGLGRLKHWIRLRQAPFLDLNAATTDRPKGVLLLGVMGAGKSLTARAIAGEWGVPLMHLDLGAIYNKYHGESERNLRAALAAAEGMAPCVLWIDELEKGLSVGGGEQDGGVSRRVLGTFLTWLSERDGAHKPVFVVATANDISSLPPELIRKGRFDEIFFVDLPNLEARVQILNIHLKKRGLDPAGFAVNTLAQQCDGFSGAEIEQALISAVFEARARGVATPSSEDIVQELTRTRPLSIVMAERINALRAWACDRAVMAEDAVVPPSNQ